MRRAKGGDARCSNAASGADVHTQQGRTEAVSTPACPLGIGETTYRATCGSRLWMFSVMMTK